MCIRDRVYPSSKDECIDVKGRDLVTGLPNTISICSNEIEEALRESAEKIVSTTKMVLENTPPELAADIINKGIILTGGGALMHGLNNLLEDNLGVPVKIAKSPLTCVVDGTGIMLDNMSRLL